MEALRASVNKTNWSVALAVHSVYYTQANRPALVNTSELAIVSESVSNGQHKLLARPITQYANGPV